MGYLDSPADFIRDRNKLLLDGGMATMIRHLSLSEDGFRGDCFSGYPVQVSGPCDVLSLVNPSVLREIHRRYIHAGADIISTNTFNANRLSLLAYGMAESAYDMALAGARVARSVADEFRLHDGVRASFPLVAGVIGPTSYSLSQESLAGCVSADNMADAIREQTVALVIGDVDLLLLETVYDLLNLEASIKGVEEAFNTIGRRLPVMISAFFSPDGTLPSGHDLDDFIDVAKSVNPFSVGVNCVDPTKDYSKLLSRLSSASALPVTFHPNAGLPDKDGQYPHTPERWVSLIHPVIENERVKIIGGCCGTTPSHISSLKQILDKNFTISEI